MSVATEVLMQEIKKILPSLCSEGVIGAVCLTFFVFKDDSSIYLDAIKPYWTKTASIIGLCRIIMDARLDYPTYNHRTKMDEYFLKDPDSPPNSYPFAEHTGLLLTDMSHRGFSGAASLGHAKWLDIVPFFIN